MAAKSNKKNNPSQSGMTLEEAIEKSRVQVAENADLVTESEAAARAATASESANSASATQADNGSTSQKVDLSDFIRRGIDISGLKENENDENLKIQPDAAEPTKVNPYTDSFNEADALPEGQTIDKLTVGQLLTYHRIKRQMSIPEVAGEIMARAATIADLENDRLCEPTAKDFAESFILRYGKLLDLDPDDLIARYRRQLSQKVTVIGEKSPRKKFDLQIARSWFMMVLIILVATAGYFVFSAQEASKKADQQNGVTITHDSQVAKDQPAVEIYASNNKGNNAPVIIEDENSGKGPEVRVVDKNTALATAQQRAMQQNGDGSTSVSPAAAAEAKSPLGLPPGAKPENAAKGTIVVNAPAQNTNISVGAAANVSVNAKADTAPMMVQAKADTAQMMVQAKADKDAKNAAAEAEKQKAEADKQKAEADKQIAVADKEMVPLLANKLKDISKSVRVVNRDGLASLNRAEIDITKPMSLKVVDSSGKVLASGTYNKGDSVKVTGIPPITVQLTATDAVKISYMGGHITMPAGKQVKFKLPMR